MLLSRDRILSSSALVATLLGVLPASAATLEAVQNFGNNPSNISMFLYKPTNLASPPPVVVALHYCSGSASAYASMAAGMVSAADQYGFIMIFPQTTAYGKCWDVFSQPSLTHDGGSDSLGIVSMVKYTIVQHGADANRVYAMGSSSGAMMTQVLLGAYPDVFKAGASFAGVPFGCWSGADTTSGWNSNCSGGNVTATGQQWGELVRAAYPSYTGYRGRIQLWHGDADATISFVNFGEAIKEWTNVFGLSETPTTTETDAPDIGFTRTRYIDSCGMVRVEAVREAQRPHLLEVDATNVVRFFGLATTAPDPGTTACEGSGGTTGIGGAGGAAGAVSGDAGGGGVAGGAADVNGGAGGTGATDSAAAGAGIAGTTTATTTRGGATTLSASTMAGRAGSTAVSKGGKSSSSTAGEYKPDDDFGCGCRVVSPRDGQRGAFATLVLLGLGAALRRFRRNNRRED